MSTTATQAVATILRNIKVSLSVTYAPAQMTENILSRMQELINEGYTTDVALAKACKIYPATKYAAIDAYK